MNHSHATDVWKSEQVALILIDYQAEMFANLRSETSPEQVELNTRLLIKIAKAFDIPVVLSTVGVEMGVNGPTRASIQDELPGIQVIDRSSMNAWDDPAFRAAIEKTGRKRLVFGALFTEICLTFPMLDAMRDGYDAMFVVDAVGGMSQLAHRTAVERLTAAGAVPNTSLALVTELFRDWQSPLAEKAREVITWYVPEAQKLSAALANQAEVSA
ncbi:isochorismatase family protein [Stenotrophomonas sp. ATCM1_4]|uniref:Isochorismatase family protein n=1 Tax=Stenotrophomonas capsici TaxID=3110230 RepID=A0ABU5V344_9GAMM|nr:MULTISPECIES: isochorismatase family protein [unclassified Stenotrophomonas]MEA5667788.1 isochorismatase family protein [Stenotrophomonas sp. MH1]TDB26272.1 isochorismatase family protein [Stenotrophomonas sp. ATCM1_4]